MASPVRTYQEEMHGNLGFFATWLPADPVDVGDIGIFEGGRFRQVSSLAELGIPCEVEVTPGKSGMQFTSTEGVQLDASGGASVPAAARLEVSIRFSGAGAFVFHASGLQLRRLRNRSQVAEAMLANYERKRWKKEWLLVESVHAAERASIIISEDNSARLVLAADVKLPQSISLADPKVGFEVSATEGKLFQTLGAKNLHPLYSCLRVKDPIFGQAEVMPVRGPGDVANHLARPGIDELLES
jgi:hypothetical protein